MRHYRYLGLLASIVCVQAGTLDELHRKIRQRNKQNGFKTTFVEVDTWTEPGELKLETGCLMWRPA